MPQQPRDPDNAPNYRRLAEHGALQVSIDAGDLPPVHLYL